MFNKIWKEQIVRPTSKVGIFKPKQGFDLEEDEDDNCNKQLQEYANKIKNTPLKMKHGILLLKIGNLILSRVEIKQKLILVLLKFSKSPLKIGKQVNIKDIYITLFLKR